MAAGKLSPLSEKYSKAILKCVLPPLAPNEMLSEYNMGPKAVKRLVKFGMDSVNKIAWISEMEKYLDNKKECRTELYNTSN